MVKIFVLERHCDQAIGEFGDKWSELGETSIARFLGDPVKIGNVFLHNPAVPILERMTNDNSHEQYNAFYNGCKLFATNYGLTRFYSLGKTHMLSPTTPRIRSNGFQIIQLTDIVLDCDKFPGFPESNFPRAKLDVAPLKMSSQGSVYRIDATYEEVIDELRKRYKFVYPEKLKPFTGLINWTNEIGKIVSAERKKRITDEFVDYANREYFLKRGKDPVTKEEMLEHFSYFGLS